MAKLIAFYSRADGNYFGGTYRTIAVGNTERAAKMLAELTGADRSRCISNLRSHETLTSSFHFSCHLLQ